MVRIIRNISLSQTTVPTSNNKPQPIPMLDTVTGHRPLLGQLSRKHPPQQTTAPIKLAILLPRQTTLRRLTHHRMRRPPMPRLATPPAVMLTLGPHPQQQLLMVKPVTLATRLVPLPLRATRQIPPVISRGLTRLEPEELPLGRRQGTRTPIAPQGVVLTVHSRLLRTRPSLPRPLSRPVQLRPNLQ
jgi:hypothetical protein